MNQQPFQVRYAAVVFAIKTFAAAMLALLIALALDMPRPYWAMASVYIASNQLAGATWSKAVYRMLGTLIGAAGTIALVPNLVDAPELLSLALALWVGTLLYFALIDGTPRSYTFLLAGYTVALLGFPIVSTPELTFDIVTARVQEIMLGIICASVVSMLVFPRNVGSAIAAQADSWLAGACGFGADVLTGRGTGQDHNNERMRLAAAGSGIDLLGGHLDYETSAFEHTARGLRRLRQHMLSLLPLLASIEDQNAALGAQGGLPADIAAIKARIAHWLADGGRDAQQADGLRAALDGLRLRPGADATWTETMAAALAIRLRNLVDVVRDCRLLREAIADGRDPDTLTLAFAADALGPVVQHQDHALALWGAAATALSVLACCTFWIATGWADGASAALFAALVGSFFAAIDDPLPAFRNFCGVILLVIAITGIYTFGILPGITTFEVLVAALMPTFVLFGWMAARPATASAGSWLAIFTSVQLALQSSYAADFASFANASLSQMAGVLITAATFGLVRLFGAEWVAGRLLRSNGRTLAAVAERRLRLDRVAIASLMQHRLALLAARIKMVTPEARDDVANLRPLRATLNIIDLQRVSPDLSHASKMAIEALLTSLASAWRVDSVGRLPGELLVQFDDTITVALQEPASAQRNEALIGLAAIRSGLFPHAPSYQPHEPEPRTLAA